MRSFTMQERVAFIQGWRSSGLTQEQYCVLHREQGGPSPRCLREWMARLAKPEGISEEARAVVVRAVEDLQELLQAFDAMQVTQARATDRVVAAGGAPPVAARGRAAEPSTRVDVSDPVASECRPAADVEPGGQSLLDERAMGMGVLPDSERDGGTDEHQGQVQLQGVPLAEGADRDGLDRAVDVLPPRSPCKHSFFDDL
jgi:hypothetical protein